MVVSKNDLTVSTTPTKAKVKRIALGATANSYNRLTEELLLEQKLRDYTLLGVEVVDKITLHFSLPSRRDKPAKIVPGFHIIYYIL